MLVNTKLKYKQGHSGPNEFIISDTLMEEADYPYTRLQERSLELSGLVGILPICHDTAP